MPQNRFLESIKWILKIKKLLKEERRIYDEFEIIVMLTNVAETVTAENPAL